jgi:Archaeal fructose-1,6-bisphosphatase and related enzymes of inositol monophosphatase family
VSADSQDQRFLSVARRLAEEAAQAVLALHDNDSVQSRKEDESPVTQADLRSDEIIRTGLLQEFPNHAILTEEAGMTGAGDSDFVWMVDPLDGTKAYAKKIPGFCVMVGLLKFGKPYLGVVVDPLEGRIYEAIRGQGAFQTFGGKKEKLTVSVRDDFSKMPLVVSTGFPEEALNKIRDELPGPLLPPINSVGIKVGLLVRQEADIYVNHHGVSYWDTCAPKVILEEAGGSFTRIGGSPLEYPLYEPYSHQTKTLASNGTLHSELVQVLHGIKF